jgi:DNA-binding CsgD family transcriptional regulator
MGLLILVLIAAWMLIMDDKDFHGTWGIRPRISTVDEDVATRSGSIMGYFEELVLRCSHAARHYGLTHREEELLVLLAQRMSSAEIEKSLCISHGTCKTHIGHVYAKLDAHSREDIVRVVDGIRV